MSQFEDLRKIEEFCSKVTNDKEYPNSLKSLEGISDETKKEIEKIVDDNLDKTIPYLYKYVELTLIKRFLNQGKFLDEKIGKIRGPVSLMQMSSKKYDQIFYLFGDHHIKINKCDYTAFEDWILKTIVNSPVFIDVFVESPYEYKDYYYRPFEKYGKSYLYDLYSLFKTCFKKEGNNTPCLTSRFHYTDMRRIFEDKKIMKDQFSFYNLREGEYKEEYAKDMVRYVEYITKDDNIVVKRIKKQLNSIKDPFIRKKFTDFFDACIKKYKDKLKGNLVRKFSKEEYKKSIKALNDYRICLMDYYLIARCFRSFKKTEKYSKSPLNIIIFAGNYHIRKYYDLLRTVGFNIDYEKFGTKDKKSKDFQCIDISDMKQPLFHQRYR